MLSQCPFFAVCSLNVYCLLWMFLFYVLIINHVIHAALCLSISKSLRPLCLCLTLHSSVKKKNCFGDLSAHVKERIVILEALNVWSESVELAAVFWSEECKKVEIWLTASNLLTRVPASGLQPEKHWFLSNGFICRRLCLCMYQPKSQVKTSVSWM